MDLKSKVVFITGGTSGIGEATAHLLSKLGCRLVISYLKDQKLSLEVEKQCKELGAEDVLMVPLNVADEASIDKTVKNITRHYQKVDILINNAGIYLLKPLEEQTNEEVRSMIDIDLTGMILLTKALLPHIQDSVINIASRAGKHASAGHIPYTAAKYGVRGFTQGLAKERGDLRVYAINPDPTATAITGFTGRPREEVAEIIVRTAQDGYGLPSGSDIDVWEIKGK